MISPWVGVPWRYVVVPHQLWSHHGLYGVISLFCNAYTVHTLRVLLIALKYGKSHFVCELVSSS